MSNDEMKRRRGPATSWLVAYVAAGVWLVAALVSLFSVEKNPTIWVTLLNFLPPLVFAALGTYGLVWSRRHPDTEKSVE
ncbi:hypothetical protein GCM10025867_08950 [Frondihabitans sucicola]|uniref:DUF2530 domain-containing protein n=1 Tax=Frondihabitans sucicola TaxID=1268041 RepID=A0ABN6XUT0_9MICO|nr:hypothetical protein GCM10025867_08950 [Frondihabitans sucicola]